MLQQRGLSLVELLISITLGLILMAGVVQMFLGSKTTFQSQQALSRVQETGRLAIEYLAKDARMAGYMGCSSRSELTGMKIDSTVDSTDFNYDFLTAVRGYSIAAASGTVYDQLSAAGVTPLPNTDVLEISSATGTGIIVKKDNSSATLFTTLNNRVTDGCSPGEDSFDGLCQNDILIVTDCVQARIFQATGMNESSGEIHITHAGSGPPGNSPTSWGGSSTPEPVLGPGAEIIKMEKKIYYIKNNTAGEPSLWVWLNGASSEVVEGVEDMIVTYGRDTTSPKDDVPDVYEDATTVTAATGWARVLSIRVEFLVRTPSTILSETQSLRFPLSATTATTFTDGRLRQVFTSTVGIRSRLQ